MKAGIKRFSGTNGSLNVCSKGCNTTIFCRELPELSRQYVMRVLFLDQPLPLAVVTSWSQPAASSQTSVGVV